MELAERSKKDGTTIVRVECEACGYRYEQTLHPGEWVYCCGLCGHRQPRPRSTMVTRPVRRLRITVLEQR